MRECTPSLRNAHSAWWRTVWGLIESRSAISPFERSRASVEREILQRLGWLESEEAEGEEDAS